MPEFVPTAVKNGGGAGASVLGGADGGAPDGGR